MVPPFGAGSCAFASGDGKAALRDPWGRVPNSAPLSRGRAVALVPPRASERACPSSQKEDGEGSSPLRTLAPDLERFPAPLPPVGPHGRRWCLPRCDVAVPRVGRSGAAAMTHLQRHQVVIGSPGCSSPSDVCLFSTRLGAGQTEQGWVTWLPVGACGDLARTSEALGEVDSGSLSFNYSHLLLYQWVWEVAPVAGKGVLIIR